LADIEVILAGDFNAHLLR
jgi:hypothetical protein